jgi:hypothetical protein
MNDIQKLAIIVGAALGFILYINLLCIIIAWWSGWRTLADHFRHEFNESDRIGGWYSARMRWGCHYNNALKVGVNQEGLALATIAIVPQHPPLLIPWNQIYVMRRSKVLWWTLIYLELGNQERISFAIYEKLFNAINRDGRLDASNTW